MPRGVYAREPREISGADAIERAYRAALRAVRARPSCITLTAWNQRADAAISLERWAPLDSELVTQEESRR